MIDDSRHDNTRRMPVLSLFSGAGGLDLGFEQVGFDPLVALDNDSAAVNTYNRNRSRKGEPAKLADLSAFSPQTIVEWWEERTNGRPVGIIGGPPCQAFSVSNVHRFEADPRARLPLSYANILRVFNNHFGIHFFVFENVAGLGHRPSSSSLHSFLEAFGVAGFRVTTFYLDSADFGIPQHRKRMFIVGFNKSLYKRLVFTPPTGNGDLVTVRDAIGNLAEPVHYARGIDPRRLGLHPNHWCMNPKSKKFNNGALKPGKMLGRSFRMLAWDYRSWTVAYGHREVHIHPSGRRRLSVFEAMLLQGFPPEYELLGTLSDQIRLVSDAVPPPLAKVLAETIRRILQDRLSLDGKAHHFEIGQSGHSGEGVLQTLAPRSTKA
jgi:DNA (cytosine-5)-methyltransferase 1